MGTLKLDSLCWSFEVTILHYLIHYLPIEMGLRSEKKREKKTKLGNMDEKFEGICCLFLHR